MQRRMDFDGRSGGGSDNLRPEYKAFPKTVIDGKVQQEKQLLKFMKQMRKKKGYDDDDDNF